MLYEIEINNQITVTHNEANCIRIAAELLKQVNPGAKIKNIHHALIILRTNFNKVTPKHEIVDNG